MPIYEYLCRECKEKFEKLVLRQGDRASVPCPRCGKTDTEQVYSAFAMAGGRTAGGGCGPSGRFT